MTDRIRLVLDDQEPVDYDVDAWGALATGVLHTHIWPGPLPEPHRTHAIRAWRDYPGVPADHVCLVILGAVCGMPPLAAVNLAGLVMAHRIDFTGWALASGAGNPFDLPVADGLALAWRYITSIATVTEEGVRVLPEGWKDDKASKLAGAIEDLRHQVFADPEGGDDFEAAEQARIDAWFADLSPGMVASG